VAIIINDGWDVTHHHIHEAFLHLGQACSYNKHATQKYRNYEQIPIGLVQQSLLIK
jgi:hypothetical protein